MKIKLLLLSCITLATNGVFAGGFKIALQGQKQTGMAGAGVGFAQDAATVYYNPGAMVFVPTQVCGGLSAIVPNVQFLETSTQILTKANPQVFTPFSVYYNQKIKETGLNVGLGVYTPFGSGVQYPTNWVGRYILNEIKLQSIYIQPTVSYKLSEMWGIGAGYIYSLGNVMLSKDLPIQTVDGSIAHAELNSKANGSGFTVGVYGKVRHDINVGATYHSRVDMKASKGTASFTNIPSALSASFPATNTFTTTLPLPSEVDLGASFELSEKLVLATDINYTFWRSFDSLGFDYGVNTSTVTDDKSPRLYKNAWAIKAGIQYNESNKLQWRAGIGYDRTPVGKNYVNPELPDNDKIIGAVGFTRKISRRIKVDGSLMYENVLKRESSNLNTNLVGTYAASIVIPGVGISVNLNHKAN